MTKTQDFSDQDPGDEDDGLQKVIEAALKKENAQVTHIRFDAQTKHYEFDNFYF